MYGNYFLHEKQAPEFFQCDEGYYSFSIKENRAIVKMEPEVGVGFLNQAKTGSLKIVKTADDDKIDGHAFKVTGTDFMGNAYSRNFRPMRTAKSMWISLQANTPCSSWHLGIRKTTSCRMTK